MLGRQATMVSILSLDTTYIMFRERERISKSYVQTNNWVQGSGKVLMFYSKLDLQGSGKVLMFYSKLDLQGSGKVLMFYSKLDLNCVRCHDTHNYYFLLLSSHSA